MLVKKEMNILILTTLILAVSVRHAVSTRVTHLYDAPQLCIPDSRFLYDNNICTCDSDGSGIVCDRSVFSSLTPSLHRSLLQNVTMECVPTRTFDFGCKKCLCDESGNYATCVRYGCNDNDFGPDTPDRCLPGSVFTVDTCNGCICGANGKASCTRLECDLEHAPTPQCIPNDGEFLFECNTCDCTSTGEIMCFKMGCSPIEFHHNSLLNITTNCEAKSIFNHNCHKCICGDGGKYAMCYGTDCSSTAFDKTKDTKDNCTPGMIFGDKCNVCVCGSDGKGACTSLNCEIDYRFEYKN